MAKTLVYKFGVRAHWDLPPEAIEQLRLAHRFRNQLVELEKLREDRVAGLWSTRPEVAELEDTVVAAEEIVAEARQAVADAKKAARGPAPKTLRDALTEARADLKTAKAQLKEAKNAAYAALKPEFEVVGAETRADQKEARQNIAAEGLHWGTYNAVADSVRTAGKLVQQKRRKGLPAEHRFQRWTGEGSLTVQLQRGAKDPARTPALLASGEGKWRNQFRLEPWIDPGTFDALPRSTRKSVGAGHAHFAIGGGQTIEIPVRVHRMIPPDGDIVLARLTRKRVGSSWRLSLTVTVKLPDSPAPEPTLPVAAVHTSWTATETGVRVATIQATAPLEPYVDRLPQGRGPTVQLTNDRMTATVRAPQVEHLLERLAGVAAQADDNFNRAIEMTQDMVTNHPDLTWPNGDPLPTRAELGQWRSHNRLAALVNHIRTKHPDALPSDLEAWRVQDKHLTNWIAHERDQISGRVREAWRIVAAWLTRQCSHIIVDDIDIAALRRTQQIEETRDYAAEAGARNIQAAAPGALREQITATAAANGITITKIDSTTGFASTHHGCGGKGTPSDSHYHLRCDACHQLFPTETNATANMLASAPVT